MDAYRQKFGVASYIQKYKGNGTNNSDLFDFIPLTEFR